jgi:hypothetical protein
MMQPPKIKKKIKIKRINKFKKILKIRIKGIFPFSTPSKRNQEERVRAAVYSVAADMAPFAADATEIKP